MSAADRSKWDSRYAEGAYKHRRHPSAFLQQHLAGIGCGAALDIACGTGRNALYLATQGFSVDAIDISGVGLERAAEAGRERHLTVNWQCQDLLEAPQFERKDYQLIIMFRFVAPQLLATLPDLLAPGGYLMVEQHLVWDAPVIGPGNTRFRVQPGELAVALAGLAVVECSEGEVLEPDGSTAALARMLVRKTPQVR